MVPKDHVDGDQKKPSCTPWYKNMPKHSLPRLKMKPDRDYPILSKMSLMPFWNVVFYPTGFCVYDVATARMKSWWRSDEIRPCISPYGSLRGLNPFQTDLLWGTRAERQAPFRDYSGRAEKRIWNLRYLQNEWQYRFLPQLDPHYVC